MRRAYPLIAFLVVATGCARLAARPLSPALPDEYRGHWEAGFETSEFTPCSGRPPGGRIWVEWGDSAYVRALRHWPQVPEHQGVSVYYVRWRGALRGPAPGADTVRGRIPLGAGYGHLSGSMYELRVSDVLEMRAARPDDCGR
jgi:hypothetical protein